ncbi:TPA: glycoside hydrolase family 99-like domain-containing protein, partial [Escherichia coli]|nr:glycoside hydrolase family 99-like domain-containing protein [Escherichia coli]
MFAYYLPQYHTIKENDEWWGEGFTEWVNLRNAKKLFPDHKIPYPIEPLGYYDLTDVKTIEKQYALAKKHEVSTFCFWHYWFDDEDLLLEKPAELILKSDIDVKFCFAWANHSWWNKSKNILLKEQKYNFSLSKYFDYLLPFFKDPRYTKIDNKPVFIIYDLKNACNGESLISYFIERSKKEGFNGVYFIGENLLPSDKQINLVEQYLNSCDFMKHRYLIRKVFDKIIMMAQKHNIVLPRIYNYETLIKKMNTDIELQSKQIPIIFPGWDSSFRHGKKGVVLKNTNPKAFEEHVNKTSLLMSQKQTHPKIVMIKSWNEWAEGNYIEPCSIHGDSYLKILAKYFDT